MADHDGRQPAVATQAGAPWYKIGYQGNENQSNTRRVFLLVKNGYIESVSLVCPACRKRPPKLTHSEIETLRDYPDRRYVTYSFQINCRQSNEGELLCRKALLADLSPLFENLPDDYRKPFQLQLNKRLLTINSINHDRKGQNVLFGDGHVEFMKGRFIKHSTDDIFTLQNTDVYRGCETPTCTTDFFLAP
jgi:prepilin-type processing-associated H-X9-DG protein